MTKLTDERRNLIDSLSVNRSHLVEGLPVIHFCDHAIGGERKHGWERLEVTFDERLSAWKRFLRNFPYVKQ